MKAIQFVVCLAAIAFLDTGCGRPTDGAVGPEQPKPASAQDVADLPGVTADEAMQRSLGITLAPVSEASLQSRVQGTATVIDTASFAAAIADLDSLRAEASVASETEKRVTGLFAEGGNASRQAVDAARQQSASLAAKLAGAESRARLDWGARLAHPEDAAARRLRADVASGAVTMFRAEFPGALGDARSLKYEIEATHHEPLVLDFIDRSRAAAQFSAGESVLLGLRIADSRNSTFRPGERVPVIATASGASHSIVPAEAAVAYQGRLWCYVARGNDQFERLVLDTDASTAAGYAAPDSIHPGDRVVVSGVALLLSLEKSASAEAGASADE
jgi:hypothetical protein